MARPAAMRLLSTSVTSPKLRGASLLLYGTCVEEMEPGVFNRFTKGRVPLHVCLEEECMDSVGFKVGTILAVAKPKDVTVLTIDGSPHCLQLHLAVEQAKRITKSEVSIGHFAVERGDAKPVSSEAVEVARHLSTIQELLRRRARP